MRLAIFTHVIHKKIENRYLAYNPYIREMNIWLKYVDEVEVIAPLPPKGESPPNLQGGSINGGAYIHSALRFATIPSLNLLSFSATMKALVRIPIILFRILGAMHRADHLHLRCPGNIGLLACICQIFFPNKQKTAKYAGNWDPDAKQPWTYKLQRWILSNTFLSRNMTVLVYGDWPNQSKNILPFFTASFSESEIEKIEKDFSALFKFLFVGNLVHGKQPFFGVEIVQALNIKNISAELHVYGDGEMVDAFKSQTRNKDYIHLHGNQPLNVVKKAYKESHFLILASKSEGWPKVVAEAMFFGCIPVVTSVSCVPWMINYGSRGILIPEVRVKRGKWKEDSQHEVKVDTRPYSSGRVVKGQRSVDSQDVLGETVDKLIELIKNPEEMKRMSREAQEWSQEYTLERFETAIKELLVPKDSRP